MKTTLLRRRMRAPAAVKAPSPPPERPTIGLALGGGAARGIAHIGVIRGLERAGFTPDIVAGTSIGAVVGGVYAAGKLDALAEWATGLTRRDVFALVDIAISGGGLMGGSRLAQLLDRDLGALRIEDMAMKFAAVATEVGGGHEIWLTRGRLVTALQASYALPGMLPPVRIGGRWLMDGALTNPVPVTVARALGARLVIGVTLNADALGRATVIQGHGTDAEDEARPVFESRPRVRALARFGRGIGRALAKPLRRDRALDESDARYAVARSPGVVTVMMKAFNASQERIARTRLAGDPPNVLVGPHLGRMGLFDFHRAAEAIARGEEAVERLLPEIEDAWRAVR